RLSHRHRELGSGRRRHLARLSVVRAAGGRRMDRSPGDAAGGRGIPARVEERRAREPDPRVHALSDAGADDRQSHGTGRDPGGLGSRGGALAGPAAARARPAGAPRNARAPLLPERRAAHLRACGRGLSRRSVAGVARRGGPDRSAVVRALESGLDATRGAAMTRPPQAIRERSAPAPVEGVARPDGRGLAQLRPFKIERGVMRNAEGSALVTMGNTRVLCSASVEDRVPNWLRGQGKGWVTAEYGMLPRATHDRTPRSAQTGGRAQE